MPQQLQKPPDLDENGQVADPNRPPDLDDNAQPIQDKGLLSKVWEGLNKPLVSLTPEMKKATESFQEEHPTLGAIGNFATDAMLGMSSPLNVGFGAAGLAESLPLGAVSKVGAIGKDLLSLPLMAEGAYHMYNQPTMGGKAAGALEFFGGAHGASNIERPTFGKAVTGLTEDITGPKIGQNISIGPLRGVVSDSVQMGTKPRFRLDTASGTYIPIDNAGNQIGPAIMPGKELAGFAQDASKFNQKPGITTPEGSRISFSDVVNIPRAIRASFDLSAPLRQGLGLAHRSEWWSSLDDMFKALGSEKAYKTINDSIRDSPNFKQQVLNGKKMPSFAERSGLFIADHVNNREETFASKLVDKIPGLPASERAYTTFLNKLRADTFDSMIRDAKSLGLDPEKDQQLAQAIAGYINTSTGRGSLGAAEKYSELLNNTFFSPRLIASRVQMLNPAYYINQPSFVRKEAIKSMMTVAGAGTLFGELAKLGGAEVSNDPSSADFRKPKFGKTRLDPYGGFQQYIVLFDRLLTGKNTSSTTGKTFELGSGYGLPNRKDIITNFAANKLNPVVRMAYDWLNQTKKQPLKITTEMENLFVPMFVQDIIETAMENPELLPVVTPASAFGMGTQTYGR